jgi:hypothetical protein
MPLILHALPRDGVCRLVRWEIVNLIWGHDRILGAKISGPVRFGHYYGNDAYLTTMMRPL